MIKYGGKDKVMDLRAKRLKKKLGKVQQ